MTDYILYFLLKLWLYSILISTPSNNLDLALGRYFNIFLNVIDPCCLIILGLDNYNVHPTVFISWITIYFSYFLLK